MSCLITSIRQLQYYKSTILSAYHDNQQIDKKAVLIVTKTQISSSYSFLIISIFFWRHQLKEKCYKGPFEITLNVEVTCLTGCMG